MKRVNINFFVIEDVSSGLFRTQVLDLARSICVLDSNISIRIIVVNRIWRFSSHLSTLKKLKKELVNSNVSISYLPLLPPTRNAVSSPAASNLLVGILQLCSLLASFYGTVDLWHARGYWTAIALHRNRVKNIIFDPRSLWIQENQSAGNLVLGSKASAYWIKQEKHIAESALHITVVSNGMQEYYYNYSTHLISVIPISAQSVFFIKNSKVRSIRRNELGWDKNTIFIYSGSLGLSGINIAALISLFDYILSQSESRLLILTEEAEDKVIDLLCQVASSKSKIKVIRPTSSEIPEWLLASDVGLHALPFQLDSATRLGTKIVEYWATGLPVLINNYVGAACQVINKNNFLGQVINLEKELPDIKSVIDNMASKPRDLIQEFAKKNYSSGIVAQKYINVYKSIIGGADD
jgi:glycosyltransferase involved in cell wall biosynthesis